MKKIKLSILSLAFLTSLLGVAQVSAADPSTTSPPTTDPSSTSSSDPSTTDPSSSGSSSDTGGSSTRSAPSTGSNGKSGIPACSGSDTAICQTNTNLIGGILKNVINFILYLAGTIAVIVIVIGGLRYITSDGDPGKASQARNSIIYALIGLAVAVLSFSIVNFVLGQL